MKKTILTSCLLCAFFGAIRLLPAARLSAADEPLYVVTHVDVIPPFAAAGRDLLKQFVAASREDPGAVRIEVLEELGRPNHSTVVEVWKDRKSYDTHLSADHTRAYRAKLGPMLGSPFDERLHGLSVAATAATH